MVVIEKPRWSDIRGPAVLFVKAEWCPHCQHTKPEIQKAAQIMGTVVPIYQIDGDTDTATMKALSRRTQIEGYPTILFMDAAGNLTPYEEGARNGRKIADWACAHSGNCGLSSRPSSNLSTRGMRRR